MCVCRQYLCIILRTRFPRRMLSILRWNIVTDHSKQSHKSFWHFSELWERANGNALKLNMFSCAFRTAPCAKWNRRWERKATFFAFHFNTNINCLVWFVSNIRFIPCKMTGRKSHCLFIYIYEIKYRLFFVSLLPSLPASLMDLKYRLGVLSLSL